MRVVICSSIIYALISTNLPAAGQSIDHAKSLGIEVPVLSIRHESVESLVNTTTTDMGIFGFGAGLNGQLAVSSRSILGARLSFSRQTSAYEWAPSVAQSQISLLPRFEYYAAPDRPVRPHIGVEAGFERATATGAPAATRWIFGPTFGIAYFPVQSWMLDFNGSLFLTTGSQSLAGVSASTSGYGFIVRVNLAKWFGGAAATSASSTAVAQVPAAQQSAPAVAPAAPTVVPAPAAQTAPVPSTDATNANSASAEPTAADVQPPENARLTLDLHEGRRLTLIAVPAGAEKRVKLILIKTPTDDSLKTCSTVELHAPKQTITFVGARYKQLSTASVDVSTLSVELTADNLKPLTLAPEPARPQLTPDHWINVCGQNWPLSTLERRQLKDYLGRL